MVGVFEGPNQRFPNLMRFLKVVPNELIVVNYGTLEPNDWERFHMTITFDEQADGRWSMGCRRWTDSLRGWMFDVLLRRVVVRGHGAPKRPL
jgi:uncharacterized protein YndB with AHSA1/START domain